MGYALGQKFTITVSPRAKRFHFSIKTMPKKRTPQQIVEGMGSVGCDTKPWTIILCCKDSVVAHVGSLVTSEGGSRSSTSNLRRFGKGDFGLYVANNVSLRRSEF